MPYPVAAVRGKNFGIQAVETYTSKVLAIESANLIAYYPMNESSGATADNAEGTAARDGSYVGVTLGQTGIGDGGTCPLFDGSNDCLEILTDSLKAAFNGSEGTYHIWIKVSASGVWSDGTARRIFNTSAPGSDNIRFEKLTNNKLRVIYQASGTNEITDQTLSDTGWFCITLTWSKTADQVKVYKDGSQVGVTATGLGTWDGTLNVHCIGATDNPPQQVWDGYLAHCIIWTTPLGQTDITSLATV